ncbi:DoxX family protein [Pseudomonas sp. dw_358]|uniref:DoxX family protein n=1 Tax=Pseudomonas sp. dw_358 TaxID=2720083 RepID=UPI001BD65798|nr:DoxX family protein [Pseudomonas sp. dw_358]
MRYNLFENQKDLIILAARVLLMILFITAGWGKITGFSGTVGYFAAIGAPMPSVAAGVAILMEFFVGIALLVGFYTRPLALLMSLFVLGTAIIGHHFWNMVEPDKSANTIQFFKNMSIIGGLWLLSVTGPGRFSVDRR